MPRSSLLIFGLSLYSVVFLLADLNSARLRSIYIDGSDLVVRVAMRWRARIPLAWIARAETTTHDIEDKEGLVNGFLVPNQNVILHIDRPVTAYGLYGIEKKFQRLSLAMDDLPAFVKALDVGE